MKKKKKGLNKQLKQQFLAMLRKFYKELDPIIEKSDLYWDVKVVDWLSAYDLVSESLAKPMEFYIKIMTEKWMFTIFPDWLDQIINRYSLKYWTLWGVMFCNVLARALNSIAQLEKWKWEDFYNINSEHLTKRDRETIRRIAKREWQIIYWI